MIDLVFSFGSMTTTQTVSDEDGARILNALRTFFLRSLPQGTTLTDADVFGMYVTSRITGFKNLVLTEEGEAAARAAKGAIPPVETSAGFK